MAEIGKKIPELPLEKSDRFVRDLGLTRYDAEVLVATKPISDFFDETIKIHPEPKKVSNWMTGDFLRIYWAEGGGPVKIFPENLARVIKMVDEGKISGLIGKKVLEESYKTGQDPEKIVREQGLAQVSDESELEKIIDAVINENPQEVKRYREIGRAHV